MTISKKALEVLKALRKSGEGCECNGFETVYLDNAKNKLEMSAHEFAGYLSALSKENFFKSCDDGFFGEVKMADEHEVGSFINKKGKLVKLYNDGKGNEWMKTED